MKNVDEKCWSTNIEMVISIKLPYVLSQIISQKEWPSNKHQAAPAGPAPSEQRLTTADY